MLQGHIACVTYGVSASVPVAGGGGIAGGDRGLRAGGGHQLRLPQSQPFYQVLPEIPGLHPQGIPSAEHVNK